VREADDPTTFMCRMSWRSGNLNLLEPSGLHRVCYGTALPLPLPFDKQNWYFVVVKILPLETVVTLTTIVHFRFFSSKMCLWVENSLELLFACDIQQFHWIRQTEELNRLFFKLYVRKTYYTIWRISQKTLHLFIEYQKHISKSFENSNHIFCSKRTLPHPLWSVLFTVKYTNYNVIYLSLFTVIIDSLFQPFGLNLSFGFFFSLHFI
jgi:hypothetical protein